MRKLMMAVTAVAGLAMVSGCKRDNVESERRDVAEAQQEAAKETAEARQEESRDIAGARQDANKEVASAQEDVREEQQDLAEAQANRQEDLNEDARERQNDVAQGGSGMAGTSAAAATSVQGRVLSTGGDSLTLVDTTNNKQLKLKTNDQTRIMQNNAPVKLDDISEGAQVRASYVMDGKDMVARELTVTKPVQKKQ
jgi:vacuolar-type H+-ATPase subunit H